MTSWLDTAGRLAKGMDTRKLVFDDPAFLPRLIDTVTEKSNNGISNTFDKSAKSTPNVPPSALETNGGNNAAAAAAHHTTLNGVSSPQPKHQEDESPSSPSRDQGGNHGVSLSDDLSDSAFETPVQASPGAASELHRAFSVLRDSCAGCSSNQDLLRETGLVDQALQFAIDQAAFACEASPSPPDSLGTHGTGARDDPISHTTGAAAAVTKGTAVPAAGPAPYVRRAVRAALQFACNYCVGNEDNRASLWKRWFPRGLMELVNGLKTDRGLLYLAVALIHNCCVAQPVNTVTEMGQGEGVLAWGSSGEEEALAGGGRERLRGLTADKAFCCLLMKVVPHNPMGTQDQAKPDRPSPNAVTSSTSSTVGHDPAMEWHYLLFCRFVEDRLVRNVYSNVGITAKGRPLSSTGPAVETPSKTKNFSTRNEAGTESAAPRLTGIEEAGNSIGQYSSLSSDKGEEQEGDRLSSEVGDAANGLSRARTMVGAAARGKELDTPGGSSAINIRSKKEMEEDDFFFPVTPEQLIVLNLAEMAAGDETVTGEDCPNSERRQASDALVEWLTALLSAMPLNQSLRPHEKGSPRSPEVEGVAREGTPATVPGRSTVSPTGTSRSGREDADENSQGNGSCRGDEEMEETRRCMREEARSAVLRTLAALFTGCDNNTRHASAAQIVEPVAEEETRLVPLCLKLLWGCGGAAEPRGKGRGASYAIGSAKETPEETKAKEQTGSTAVPAGRKVELLKVIGNACFRCKKAQDLVREVGGLPLVLNHCAVDAANPLLREYALLAVRNLCEGNTSNQEAIAAIQPQGCTPGMDEALADMGLEGHVDADGKFHVGPRPPDAR